MSYCDSNVSIILIVRHSSCIVNVLACVSSRGHIFSPIIMKLGQNVCLDEIANEFENGSCWVKTRSLVQILEKPCVCCRSHMFSLIIMKLGQNVCLDEISDRFENGSCWAMYVLMTSQICVKMGQVRSKTRSVGQILEKTCVCSRGHIFSQIIVKLGQNVCLDEILHEFENRLCWVKNYVTRSNLRKTLCTL